MVVSDPPYQFVAAEPVWSNAGNLNGKKFGSRMSLERQISEWNQVRQIAEFCLKVAKNSDYSFVDLTRLLFLPQASRGNAIVALREQRLDAVRKTLAERIQNQDRFLQAHPGAEARVGAAVRNLQPIAERGNSRALSVLAMLAFAFPRLGAVANDRCPSFAAETLRGLLLADDVGKACLAEFRDERALLRDTGKGLWMDPLCPTLELRRPEPGTTGLFVIKAGASVLLAQTEWHVLRIANVRRRWCAGQLIQRLGLPLNQEVGESSIWDYALDGLVCWSP